MPPDADHRKNRRLLRRYGITLDTYHQLYRIQNGVCAICQRPERRDARGVLEPLCVDHSHLTGRVRGLLCHHCNTAIGKLKDNVDLMRRAIAYLQQDMTRAER